MVLAGHNVQHILDNNSYNGLKSTLKFKEWKKMIKEEINVKLSAMVGVEPLDLNKLHEMVEEACEGLAGVSASQVEIQSDLSFMMASAPQTFRRP